MEEVKEYALSDADLRKAFKRIEGGMPPIVSYPQLANIRDIDEILDNHGRAIILYLTEGPNVGHWVGIMKRKGGYEFMDPYGGAPDSQLEYIPMEMRQQLNQVEPHLTNLFRGSGKKLQQSPFKFQKDGNNVNTCGRHILSRMALRDLTLKQYADMIKSSGQSPDEFVSVLSYKILGR